MLGRIKKYVSFLSELANVNHYEWHIAIRKRSAKTLFQGDVGPFLTVPNNWRYWRADPFLFQYRGKDYLFAEMYDRCKQKGVIGVCRIRNGKCGSFKVCLELPYHVSYPCVFEDEDGIHMVPECSESGELWMYRCTSFPMKWEKERCIAMQSVADATPLRKESEYFWFATHFEDGMPQDNDNLSLLTPQAKRFERMINYNARVRPAGHFIETEEGMIRPSQNCTDTYGGNLIFWKVKECNANSYHEEPMLSVYSADRSPKTGDLNSVSVSSCPVVGTSYDGVHTYNFNERYEVIDLKYRGAKSCVSLWRNLKLRYFPK